MEFLSGQTREAIAKVEPLLGAQYGIGPIRAVVSELALSITWSNSVLLHAILPELFRSTLAVDENSRQSMKCTRA